MRKNKPDQPSRLSRLAQVLPQVSVDLALDQKVKEWAVLRLWDQCLPEAYQGKTQANRIRNRNGKHILEVVVSDPTLASHLAMMLDQLCEAINQFTPQTGVHIDGIAFKIRST